MNALLPSGIAAQLAHPDAAATVARALGCHTAQNALLTRLRAVSPAGVAAAAARMSTPTYANILAALGAVPGHPAEIMRAVSPVAYPALMAPETETN